MSASEDLAKLKTLAALVLDHKLAGLQTALRAKEQSEAALAGLGYKEIVAAGLQGAAAHLAALNYQRWADARRSEINVTLAAQTRVWMDAREAAREAFGKAEALKALAQKVKEKPRTR